MLARSILVRLSSSRNVFAAVARADHVDLPARVADATAPLQVLAEHEVGLVEPAELLEALPPHDHRPAEHMARDLEFVMDHRGSGKQARNG